MGQKTLLKSDVNKLLQLIADREWAEHFAESDLGRNLESAVTDLHNEISELQDKVSELQAKLDNQPVVDLPYSDAIRLHGNMMYSDAVVTALQKAGVKYKW